MTEAAARTLCAPARAWPPSCPPPPAPAAVPGSSCPARRPGTRSRQRRRSCWSTACRTPDWAGRGARSGWPACAPLAEVRSRAARREPARSCSSRRTAERALRLPGRRPGRAARRAGWTSWAPGARRAAGRCRCRAARSTRCPARSPSRRRRPRCCPGRRRAAARRRGLAARRRPAGRGRRGDPAGARRAGRRRVHPGPAGRDRLDRGARRGRAVDLAAAPGLERRVRFWQAVNRERPNGRNTFMALWDQLKERAADMSAERHAAGQQVQEQGLRQREHGHVRADRRRRRHHHADERRKTAGFISSNDVLSIFPPSELLEKFNHFSGKLEPTTTSARSRPSRPSQAEDEAGSRPAR